MLHYIIYNIILHIYYITYILYYIYMILHIYYVQTNYEIIVSNAKLYITVAAKL